jgi:hypothetical protein
MHLCTKFQALHPNHFKIVLENPREFHKGRMFNLAPNFQLFKILFLSHTLFKCSLPWLIRKLATRHICLPNSKFYTQINEKLSYKPREGLWKFSKISSSLELSLLISTLSKVPQSFKFFSFFSPSTKINHSSPLKESCGKKVFFNSNKKLCPRKKAHNDLSSPFKEND